MVFLFRPTIRIITSVHIRVEEKLCSSSFNIYTHYSFVCEFVWKPLQKGDAQKHEVPKTVLNNEEKKKKISPN